MALSKIQTAEEKEKKDKRLKIFMTIFMVVVLGASTAAYALIDTGSSQRKTYNGITFTLTQSGWNPKKMNIYTSYLPSDVENISIDGSPSLDSLKGNLYLNALGNNELNAANELLKTLAIEKRPTLACSPAYENESFCADLPIKSCDDASAESPLISFEQANETSISYKNYCLVIKGDNENMIKAADRVIFGLYGIIKT
jgi:hypothetical protein